MRARDLRLSILIGAILPFATPALAEEYPCPSDPGFCYRDLGDDVCFDPGVDEGPINEELEASSTFPDPPPPGTVVCPPSVKRLVALHDIEWQTPPGSSILIYGATLDTDGSFETISGGRLLLDGWIRGLWELTLNAEDDIDLSTSLRRIRIPGGVGAHLIDVDVESQNGDIRVAPGVRFPLGLGNAEFLAPAGDITFGEKVKFKAADSSTPYGNVAVVAGGHVEMNAPRLQGKPHLRVTASSIEVKGKGVFGVTVLTATDGEVTIERARARSALTIAGDHVTIGTAPDGEVKQSRISSLRITAGGPVRLENLNLRFIDAETTGTSFDVRDSKLSGRSKKDPREMTISALGAGSTCDITGTEILKAILTTNCDTVIGP